MPDEVYVTLGGFGQTAVSAPVAECSDDFEPTCSCCGELNGLWVLTRGPTEHYYGDPCTHYWGARQLSCVDRTYQAPYTAVGLELVLYCKWVRIILRPGTVLSTPYSSGGNYSPLIADIEVESEEETPSCFSDGPLQGASGVLSPDGSYVGYFCGQLGIGYAPAENSTYCGVYHPLLSCCFEPPILDFNAPGYCEEATLGPPYDQLVCSNASRITATLRFPAPPA
jgi:hypothetical protein